MKDGVHSRPEGGAPYERHPPVADWSVAASHLVESAALDDIVAMLARLRDGCALPEVDLTGLSSDRPAPVDDAGHTSAALPSPPGGGRTMAQRSERSLGLPAQR